jgi:hypothetical protein
MREFQQISCHFQKSTYLKLSDGAVAFFGCEAVVFSAMGAFYAGWMLFWARPWVWAQAGAVQQAVLHQDARSGEVFPEIFQWAG